MLEWFFATREYTGETLESVWPPNASPSLRKRFKSGLLASSFGQGFKFHSFEYLKQNSKRNTRLMQRIEKRATNGRCTSF